MGTEHEAAAKAMVDKVMALLARARAADAAARDAKALLAGAVRRILAADSGPEENRSTRARGARRLHDRVSPPPIGATP